MVSAIEGPDQLSEEQADAGLSARHPSGGKGGRKRYRLPHFSRGVRPKRNRNASQYQD